MKPFRILSATLPFWLILLLVGAPAAGKKPVVVGFDGAYAVKQATSAQAIERGLSIAIHEINQGGGVLGGRPFELVTTNNRMVPARGVANLKKMGEIEDIVAVFVGRFSPVILRQVPTAHELKMILLDVWGAADEITEITQTPNFVFRLSLKDQWAMPVMLDYAASLGKKRIGVLLPNTAWGRSNQRALQRAMVPRTGLQIQKPVWYNWGDKDMLQFYNKAVGQKAEVLLLVANDFEGSTLIRQLARVDPKHRIPIVSHWGITGGKMVEASGPMIHEVDLSIIQTFSFFKARGNVLPRFMATAKKLYDMDKPEDFFSPVGFAHAYDMMHILARAVAIAGTTDRSKIRDALETVRDHEGLIRFYKRPFTPTRHDALSLDQVFMARYRKDGVLVPIP